MMNPHFVKRFACPGCENVHLQALRAMAYDDPVMHKYLDAFYQPFGAIPHDWLVGARFSLVRCQDCGLVFQEEIPGPEMLVNLYEIWIDPQRVFDVCERAHPLQRYCYLARQVEMVLRYFNRKPGEIKMLDFGMGWGDWCRFAQAYGADTYGLELSASRIRRARSQGIRVLDVSEMDGLAFDMINAEQVFEHLPDPLVALRALRARLKPEGLIWIAVPNGADLSQRIAIWDWRAPKDSPRSLNAVAPLEHLNGFTHDALVRMAALAGLKPVAVPRPRAAAAAAIVAPPADSPRRRWLPFGRHRPAHAAATPIPAGTELYFTPTE